VRITVDDLRAIDACEDGIDAFREVCGDVIEGEWTAAAQAYALGTLLRQYFGWAVHFGLIPMWSMAGWNLTDADLRDADLTRANLTDANLRDADLTGANLYGANLRCANLCDANLTGANLYGANLYGHNVDELRLRGAIVFV